MRVVVGGSVGFLKAIFMRCPPTTHQQLKEFCIHFEVKKSSKLREVNKSYMSFILVSVEQ